MKHSGVGRKIFALWVSFIQHDHMFQQVSSATADPALGDSVLPVATKGRAYGYTPHLSCWRDHILARARIAVEEQESLSRRVGPRLAHLLDNPKDAGILRHVAAKNLAPR